MAHNGDDAYALIKLSTGDTIDIFGNIGCDPGSAWTGGSNFTANNTLIRNSNIQVGVNSDPANPPCEFPTLGSEWTSLGIDDASNLGLHAGPPSTPYGYTWSNSSTDEDQSNLAAGTYTVTVLDVAGCTQTAEIIVSEPTALTIQCVKGANGDVDCNGGNDGFLSSSSTGGTAPYIRIWTNSNGDTVSTLAVASNLVAGTYTLTVTDANGCTGSCTETVNEPAALTLISNCNKHFMLWRK